MTRKGKKFDWKESDIAYLKEHYGRLSLDDMAIHLGVSHTTVRMKAIEIGLETKHVRCFCEWTEERLNYLKEHYPTMALTDLATYIGFSTTTISSKARELGLKRAEGYDRGNFRRRYVNGYRNVV